MIPSLFITITLLLGLSFGHSISPRPSNQGLVFNPANPNITLDYPADSFAFVGNMSWTVVSRGGRNVWVHESRWNKTVKRRSSLNPTFVGVDYGERLCFPRQRTQIELLECAYITTNKNMIPNDM
jgi:hypothetical protein